MLPSACPESVLRQQFKSFLDGVEGDQKMLLVPFLNCEPQTEIITEVVCGSSGMEAALLLFYCIMVIEGSSSLRSRYCCVCCLWAELFLGVLKAVVEILGKRRNEINSFSGDMLDFRMQH